LMFAIIRRAKAGKPLMAADRQHMHHRLLNIGHSYRQSVLLMYLWAALFSVTVVSLSLVRTPSVVFVAATLVAVLALLPATMPRLRPWRSGQRAKPAPKARPAAPIPPAHAAPAPVPSAHADATQLPPAHADVTHVPPQAPPAPVPPAPIPATAAPVPDVPRFLPSAPPDDGNGHWSRTPAPSGDGNDHWSHTSAP